MTSRLAYRVSALLTVAALLYLIVQLIAVYGFSGVAGLVLSLGVAAAALVALSRYKG